jgi:hypothetical protein
VSLPSAASTAGSESKLADGTGPLQGPISKELS